MIYWVDVIKLLDKESVNNKPMNEEDETTRNKGTTYTSGKIIKGTLNEAPIKMKVSSIPSKQQRMVFRSYSQPAFGDSTNKFSSLSTTMDSFQPGPANYNVQPKNEKVYSNKGFGSLASNSGTFRNERSRTHIPGPGTYTLSNKKRITSKIYKRTPRDNWGLNSSQTTAALSTQIQDRSIFKKEIEHAKALPGPGLYELNPEQIKNASVFLFRSKSKRFLDKQSNVPPVGTYQLESRLPPKYPQTKYAKESPMPRNKHDISEKMEKLFGVDDKKRQPGNIGPQSYDPIVKHEIKGFSIRDSIHDRFGNLKPIYKIAKTIQIPQKDQMQNLSNVQGICDNRQLKGLTSMFKSTTKRSEVKLHNQMDPCAYSHIKSSPKKSHFINFQKKWI